MCVKQKTPQVQQGRTETPSKVSFLSLRTIRARTVHRSLSTQSSTPTGLCAYNQIGYLIVSKFIDEDFADEDAKPVTAIVGLQAVLMHAIVHACMCRFC
jgi:hypothetical protein